MALNYKKLKTEITTDPIPRGYGDMTDNQIADSLNAEDRIVPRGSISGSELFGYTDESEYISLTANNKNIWLSLCGIDFITKAAVPLVKSLFNAASVTWDNIVKIETVTRLVEIGVGTDRVSEQIVFNARTGSW